MGDTEAQAKIDDCYQKCRILSDMLHNKLYDRDLTRASVYHDPSETNAYPPLLPELYVKLLLQHTSSTATQGAQQSNPLHLHVKSLTEFVLSHSLEVPKTSIQIHANLCQHDPPVCERLCGDPAHLQQQFSSIPLLSMPVVSQYDATNDKIHYHRLTEQLAAVPDPATQYVPPPPSPCTRTHLSTPRFTVSILSLPHTQACPHSTSCDQGGRHQQF
jgi:hypothetical protein